MQYFWWNSEILELGFRQLLKEYLDCVEGRVISSINGCVMGMRGYVGVIDAGAKAAVMIEIRRDIVGHPSSSSKWKRLIAALCTMPVEVWAMVVWRDNPTIADRAVGTLMVLAFGDILPHEAHAEGHSLHFHVGSRAKQRKARQLIDWLLFRLPALVHF
jgi:hypothetical protein